MFNSSRIQVLSRDDGRFFTAGLVLSAVILTFDLMAPLGVAAGVPYILAVLICLRSQHPATIFLMALLGTVLTIVGYVFSPEGGVPWVVLTNRGLAVGGIWAAFVLTISIQTETRKRKDAEQAGRSSQNQLSGILKIGREAIITISDDMTIQFFNDGACSLFGYQPAEVVGRTMGMLMPERFRHDHAKAVLGFSGSPNAYRLMEESGNITGMRKDGSEFIASASVSKIDVDGRWVFTVMMVDITERVQAEEDRRLAMVAAEEASHAKSQFLASMSHELRTPLNAILGFSEIMALQYMGPLGEKKYEEYADDIHNSAAHLLSLVNDLLDLSSIEAGKQELTKETLSIEGIAAGCAKTIARAASDADIEINLALPDDLSPLYADARSIKQILLNLLNNAIKFTPAGGSVTLSAMTSAKQVTIRVEDTGDGIPSSRLPELARPFVKGERDPHKAVEGWGLGLAISKSLIELHDGELLIESEVGKGTTVTVELPNHA